MLAPNSSAGPAIWMAGGGPAADSAGNVYLLTANGAFETTLDAQGFPNQGDFGNSFVKISNAGGALAVADYFALTNTVAESAADRDLGLGRRHAAARPDGLPAAPSTTWWSAPARTATSMWWIATPWANSAPTANNIFQQLTGALPGGVLSTPAYFNGTVYYGDVGGTLKAFAISNAKLSATPQSQSAAQFTYPGHAPQPFRPTARPTASSGRTKIPIPRCCTPTTPPISRTSCTTAIRPPQAATNSAPATNTSRRPSPTARCSWGRTNSVAVFGLLH